MTKMFAGSGTQALNSCSGFVKSTEGLRGEDTSNEIDAIGAISSNAMHPSYIAFNSCMRSSILALNNAS